VAGVRAGVAAKDGEAQEPKASETGQQDERRWHILKARGTELGQMPGHPEAAGSQHQAEQS